MASTPKNILLIGHVEHGKSTLIKALQTVLSYRYGIGAYSTDSFIATLPCQEDEPPFECTIGNLNLRFIHFAGHADYETYIPNKAFQIDAAILVCSVATGAMGQTQIQCDLCKKHGIPIACVYFSNGSDYDSTIFNYMEEDVLNIVGDNGCKNTKKLTEEFETNAFGMATLNLVSKNCPTFVGDSIDAIEHPLKKNADILIRVLNCIRVAVE